MRRTHPSWLSPGDVWTARELAGLAVRRGSSLLLIRCLRESCASPDKGCTCQRSCAAQKPATSDFFAHSYLSLVIGFLELTSCKTGFLKRLPPTVRSNSALVTQ